MAAIDAFGDAALDADLASILGLGTDRDVPPGRPRSSFDPSRYRAHALWLLVTVPVLAIVVAIVGTLQFLRPEGSSDRVDTRPAPVVANRPVVSGPSFKFVAAPATEDDTPVIATRSDVVAPPVATAERQSTTKAASAVGVASPKADLPAGTAIAPLADYTVSQSAVEIPPPAPPSVANGGQAGSANSAAIVEQAALPAAERSSEEARLERSRRDNVSAIRSLRRQF